MGFVLKKSKSYKMDLQIGNDVLTLSMKRIKVQKILKLYQDHGEILNEFLSGQNGGGQVNMSKLPLKMLEDLREIVLESTAAWDAVDEDGNPVEYSQEKLAEIIDHEPNAYMGLMKVFNSMAGSMVGESEKNSASTSNSAKVH